MSESQSDHVELKEFSQSSQGVESIIDFCYSGNLNITFDNIDQLLHAATHLQIIDAIDLCCEFLRKSCSISNCIDIYKIADLYFLKNLFDYVRLFISNNFLRLMFNSYEQYQQLTYEQISTELIRDTLDMNNYREFDLFRMICLWIDYDRNQREKHALDLFRLIRFMLMSPEELTDHVRNHRLIKVDEQSRRLVEDALCFYALPNRQPLLNSIQCRIRNHSVLVAVGEVDLFVLKKNAHQWDILCQAPFEENYPVNRTNKFLTKSLICFSF